MSDSDLFDEFPEVSAKQWKQQIQVDLKGADYNDTLVWDSPEGIKVKPFYHAEDLKDTPSLQPPKSHAWKVAQKVFAGDAAKANAKAREILAKGVESLLFTIPTEDTDFKTLLSGIDLNTVPLHFNFEFLATEPIKRLLDEVDGANGEIYLNIDIIGNLARSGNWYHTLEKDHELLESVFKMVGTKKNISVLAVDLGLYQNSGANMVQQLAYGLAHANEYLGHFGSSNHFPVTFMLAAGSNYFFEIAKHRALRWLWDTLVPAYGIDSEPHIVSIPSKRNKTLYDYNLNMLRSTSECMSAILGGADTVCNLPYDAIYHKDNDFGERISRNQLLLLKEESYLSEASQIPEGAYYIEFLTQELAERALSLFKQIEASGGFLEALKKGTVQQKIAETAQKEQQLFDENAITLVGTNKFQNPDDRMKGDLELYPFLKNKPRKTLVVPILEKRLAETTEQKRLDNE